MLQADAEIHETRRDRIAVNTTYHLKDSVKAVPGARWDTKEKIWTVPLSWTACLALRAEFGDGLNVGHELREWAKKESEKKVHLASLRPVMTPTELPDLPELPGFNDLFDHQRVDAYAISKAERYILLNETGTGKSRSALAGLSLLADQGADIFPMLVVAPKSMLITWSREVEGFFPGADVRVCQGTPSHVRKQIEPGGDVYAISWNSLRMYSRQAPYGNTALKPEDKNDKELQAIGFKSAIMDEVHRGKNGEAQCTRAAWAATQTCEYVVGLTGTPVQESPEDLWALLRLIAPHEYPTKTSYMERWVKTDYNMWGGREVVGLLPERTDEFFKNFDARTRRVTKEMSLDLPDKIYSTRWVELPSKLRKAYNQMHNSLVAELEDSTLAAENVLTRATRLLQLSNAWGDVDEDGKYTMQLPSPKIEAFMDDIKEGDYDGQQVVVFSDSAQLVNLLEVAMRKKKLTFTKITGAVTGEDRQIAIDEFQRGDAQFCLITRAAGEGVTLTAASTMVRLIRPWSYTVYTQAEDRVHRIGSERHEVINYIDYVTERTVEEVQLVRLNSKEARAQEVLRDRDLLDLLKKVDP